jgi:hypothetical protein
MQVYIIRWPEQDFFLFHIYQNPYVFNSYIRELLRAGNLFSGGAPYIQCTAKTKQTLGDEKSFNLRE